jgi:hypothetical protein
MSDTSEKQIYDKDFIPNFFPTYRIKRNLYPIPIIIVVVVAGILAYMTYVLADVKIDGGYIPGGSDPFIGLLNGIIFTATAVISAFVMIYFAKKKGLIVLKFIFGLSFGFLGFFLTLFFADIVAFLIFVSLPLTQLVYDTSIIIRNIVLPIASGIFTLLILYKYMTEMTLLMKNFLVIYIGLLTGALLGVIMPLWTTLAILIGISCWDIFAVLYKRGPIKEMIDLASQVNGESPDEEEIQKKIESGEAEYGSDNLEIGIGDLTFYSMLTSSALILSNNLIVMILSSIAIIIGTGITISGLKRNKVLPGLPISIFLGIGTMLISWFVISLI